MCACGKQASLLYKTNKYFQINKNDTGYHKARAKATDELTSELFLWVQYFICRLQLIFHRACAKTHIGLCCGLDIVFEIRSPTFLSKLLITKKSQLP
jgi:hypothetical protein